MFILPLLVLPLTAGAQGEDAFNFLSLLCNQDASNPLQANCTATVSSNVGATIGDLLWSFEGGGATQAPNGTLVNNTFSAPGTYSVVLTVQDDQGNAVVKTVRFLAGEIGEGDRDNDGIADADDNCPDDPNFGQEDEDGDGVGDACEGRGGNGTPGPGDDLPEDSGALVPCRDECGFQDFLVLVNNVLERLMQVAVMLATLGFVYAGFLYVTNNGDTGRIDKGKKLFKNIFIGLIIAVAAWLIVNSLVGFLLSDEYKEALQEVRNYQEN